MECYRLLSFGMQTPFFNFENVGQLVQGKYGDYHFKVVDLGFDRSQGSDHMQMVCVCIFEVLVSACGQRRWWSIVTHEQRVKTIMGHRADLGMLLPRHKICIRWVFWELLSLVVPQRTCILPVFKVIDSYNFYFLFCL